MNNSAVRTLIQVKDKITQLKLPIEGEGTHILYTGPQAWSHVSLRIEPSDRSYKKTFFSSKLENFPEIYKEEISEMTDTFTNIYTFLNDKYPDFQIEILDATHFPGQTGRMNFQKAVANAIINAIDPKLHQPNLKGVKYFKDNYMK